MLICNEIKVPWERVFVHGDALLSRDIYVKTPSHCFGNHQSNVRYWSKMRLLVGLCSKIAQRHRRRSGAGGARGARPRLVLRGADRRHGQRPDQRLRGSWPGNGYVCFNRRMMYGALEWCTQNYTQIRRRAARADGRRRVSDAGQYLGDARCRARPRLPDLLADAAERRASRA